MISGSNISIGLTENGIRIKHTCTKAINSILVKKKLSFDYIDGATAEYVVSSILQTGQIENTRKIKSRIGYEKKDFDEYQRSQTETLSFNDKMVKNSEQCQEC
jgi:hypothetical protein